MIDRLKTLRKSITTVQREGQARQGSLKRVCPKFRTDAKPKKHTQTLALRKVGGIVRFWKGWCGERHGVLLRGLWELQYNDSDLLCMRLRAYSERFRVRR